jgi:hypothetical protein
MQEKEDLRKEVLHKHVPEYGGIEFQTWVEQKIYMAMDEYAKAICLDMLEYMGKNEIECFSNGEGGVMFSDKKKGVITKTELFKNFL